MARHLTYFAFRFLKRPQKLPATRASAGFAALQKAQSRFFSSGSINLNAMNKFGLEPLAGQGSTGTSAAHFGHN